MEHSSLSTSLIIRVVDRVVSRLRERQHGHRTLMHKRPVAAHPDGQVAVHQIRTRVVTEEPPRGTLHRERRIHGVATVARHPHGTPRRTPLTHTQIVVGHRRGMPLHGHLIRTRKVAKPLPGIPPHEHPAHTLTRAGPMMVAEHPVRGEAVGNRITIH